MKHAHAKRASGLELVASATIIRDFIVELTFDNGQRRRIDLEPALTGPIFEPVRDPTYFAMLRVDHEAGTIVWPNGADIAPEYLYENSTPV